MGALWKALQDARRKPQVAKVRILRGQGPPQWDLEHAILQDEQHPQSPFRRTEHPSSNLELNKKKYKKSGAKAKAARLIAGCRPVSDTFSKDSMSSRSIGLIVPRIHHSGERRGSGLSAPTLLHHYRLAVHRCSHQGDRSSNSMDSIAHSPFVRPMPALAGKDVVPLHVQSQCIFSLALQEAKYSLSRRGPRSDGGQPWDGISFSIRECGRL